MKHVLTASLLFAASAACAQQIYPQGEEQKKYIAFGWEYAYVTPQDFLDNVDQFMATPIDGVGINVLGDKAAGRRYQCFREILHKPLWTRQTLGNLVEPLRKMAAYPCFRESFLGGWQPPKKRLAWTDDEAWSVASNNLRAVTWLAREAHLPGIKFDIEDYHNQKQFFRVDDDPPYPELVTIVRQRGREVFGGIFREYPDVTLFMFWLLSDAPYRHVETDLPGLMRERGDLWWAFVNGMLDVLPPEATVVDGSEDAYKYEAARRDFHSEYVRIFNWDLPLVMKENRAKYLSQVSLSFGLYIDMYVNDENAGWYFGPVDGSRLKHFERNLAQATSAARKYVWFWSECGRWTRWSEELRKDPERLQAKARLLWEDAIPGGIFAGMRAIKDPGGFLKPRLEKAIVSGELKSEMDGKSFQTWKDSAPKGKDGKSPEVPGRLYVENGELRGEGLVYGGCFHNLFENVRQGDVYFLKGFVKGEHVSASVSYKDFRGKWLFGVKAMLIPGSVGADGWREVCGFVAVPDIARDMNVTLGFKGQKDGEISAYRDFGIYNVSNYDGWRK